MKKRRYRLVDDDDGHWYLIPANKNEEFVDWVNTDEGPGFDDCRINSPTTITFENPIDDLDQKPKGA